MDPHELAERRSLAFHRQVAALLDQDVRPLAIARARVNTWVAANALRGYAEAWQQLLARPLPELQAALAEDSARMRALRQATPFAGALSPQERWRIWREVRAQSAGVPCDP